MKQEDKRLLKPVLLIAAALTAALLLSTLIVTERGDCGENITWTLRANGRLTVHGAGQMPDYDAETAPSPFYNRSVVTAEVQEGVASIGNAAFYGCLNMRKISLPQSVESIGERAFRGCSRLKTVVIDKDNPAYTFENGTLLSKDGGTLLFRSQQAGGKEYAVPQGVTGIAAEAFYGCKKLERVVLPNSIVEIGEGAFRGCARLTQIDVPDNADYAFTNGVLYGRNGASLLFCAPAAEKESFTVPESVSRVGEAAFSGCKALTSVTLPAGLESIGKEAFRGCTKLADVYFTGDEAAWNALPGAVAALADLENVTVHFE